MCCLPYDFFAQAFRELPAESRGLSRYPTHAERGCVTRLDILCVYKGYWSDQKIVVCVGEPDPRSVDVYEDHRMREEFMRSYIKAGMTKAEVYHACLARFTKVDRYPFYVHGIGRDAQEEPRLGNTYPNIINVEAEVTFEVNSVIALEPSWLVEDDYVMHQDGFERLGKLPQTIMRF